MAGELLLRPYWLGFPVLLGFCDARSDRPFHPFHRYPGSLARTRCPFHGCRVASAQASTLILNRSRQRAPNLSASDRILAGCLALWLRPTRLLRSAIVLKRSTLLGLHQTMCKQKYRVLFSPNHSRKPGPKGPSAELIHAVVEMKQRNLRWGCPRIAQPIAWAFKPAIDKDVVRRGFSPSRHHYWPGGDAAGPSWLTFVGHTK